MADNYSICIIGLMDRLWFHQIVLLSDSTVTTTTITTATTTSLLLHKSLKKPNLTSSLISLPTPSDDEISFSPVASPPTENEVLLQSSSSPPLNPLEKLENEAKDYNNIVVENQKERPRRLSLVKDRARSQSSSPSTKKGSKNILRSYASMTRLRESMSCRSMGDLELEEVKGFMDLGFIFDREHLNPRMMSVVPGLQRLGLNKNKHNNKIRQQEGEEEVEPERAITRPYLSEAWLIKRPDSPLLNLRLPRVSAAADMKKHLKFWAKTVASAIQLEF